MQSSLVPIIIPYFRAPAALERCVAAIRASTYSPTDIFIRDNSDDNILFTAAINEGLRKYLFDPQIQFALILNQDAYLQPGTLSALVEAMEANPKIGIACPVQYEADGVTINWAGSHDSFPAGWHQLVLKSETNPYETYWANGAAMLVRMEMVREIGLFDANMKFICSDADYSYTARARGWMVTVVPTARIEHTNNASQKNPSPTLNDIKIRDIIYFGEKWITGDLFRQLAVEGKKMTAVTAKFELNRLRAQFSKDGS
jgi:GT2 family glycosyltransferase